MKLVEKHIIKKTDEHFGECDRLSFLAKNLYNSVNYHIRQSFCKGEDGKYISFGDVDHFMIDSNQPDYRALPAKVSKGILRSVDKSWKGFFKSIKDWSKNPSKYLGRPKLPKYKHKLNGRYVVPYERGAVSKRVLKRDNVISLSRTNILIPTKVTYEQLQAVRIVPRIDHYVIEVIYNKKEKDYGLNKENYMGIDLGVSNLATIACSNGSTTIVNGRPLKSINQFYNKRKAFLQSKLKPKQYLSKNLLKLTYKRNNKVTDYLHRASKYVIYHCLANDIGTIIIGSNKEWKQGSNLGKKSNQNFVSIPFDRFKEMIKYKAELVGIEVHFTEESYTSKCSFVDGEPLKRHSSYTGKRVKRGLFRTKEGLKLNADVNGAFNIIKKVFPLFSFKKLKYGIEDVAVHPLRVTPALT